MFTVNCRLSSIIFNFVLCLNKSKIIFNNINVLLVSMNRGIILKKKNRIKYILK